MLNGGGGDDHHERRAAATAARRRRRLEPANAAGTGGACNVFTQPRARPLAATTPRAPSALPATGRIDDDWGPSNNDVQPPLQRRHEQQPAAELQRQPQLQRVQRAAVHAFAPASTTTATWSSTIARRRRPQHGARDRPVDHQRLLHLWLDVRQAGRTPGGINFRSDGGGLAVSQAAAQSAGRFRLSLNVQRPEPHEPRQPDRLHRNAHVDQLRAADDGPGHAQGGYRHGAVVLVQEFT